jgi:hypothetical protein
MAQIKPENWVAPTAETVPTVEQVALWKSEMKAEIKSFVNGKGKPCSYEEVREQLDKLGNHGKYQYVDPGSVIAETHKEMNPKDFEAVAVSVNSEPLEEPIP